jgi:hypothetical protein
MKRNWYMLAGGCLLGGLGLTGSSGWDVEIGYAESEEGVWEDTGGQASEESDWGLVVSGWNRSRAGQLAWDLGYEFLETDWTVPPFLDALPLGWYREVETASSSVMWTEMPGGLIRSENWGYTLLLGIESSRATESVFDTAGFSDALSLSGGASMNYHFGRDLVVGFGFRYSGSPAGIDDNWFPVIQVYWKINPEWTLQTRNGVLLSWVPEATAWEDAWTASVLWRSRAWHLGDSGSVEMGYEDEGIPIGLAYRVEWIPGLSLEPAIEYVFNREVTIWENSRKAEEYDLDDGWRFSLGLKYAF